MSEGLARSFGVRQRKVVVKASSQKENGTTARRAPASLAAAATAVAVAPRLSARRIGARCLTQDSRETGRRLPVKRNKALETPLNQQVLIMLHAFSTAGGGRSSCGLGPAGSACAFTLWDRDDTSLLEQDQRYQDEVA